VTINNGAGFVRRWNPASPWQIKNDAFAALDKLPGFSKFYRDLTYPTNDVDCPALIVALGPDRASAEGQGNQGVPHLRHVVTLLVSVVALAESDIVLDGSIHELADEVRAALFNNGDFMRESIESLDGMDTQILRPRESDMNFMEVRMLIYCTTVSYWLPKAEVDLREMQIARKLSETETAGAPPGTLPQPLLDDVLFPASGTDDYAEQPGTPGATYEEDDPQ
jgi:hypothetical protein